MQMARASTPLRSCPPRRIYRSLTLQPRPCKNNSRPSIPKTLAVNAAKDATELIAKLRALHARSKTDSALRYSGLDLINGTVRDNFKAGVLEPALSKVKAMRFATEAAVTILRIDDLIELNKSEKPGR